MKYWALGLLGFILSSCVFAQQQGRLDERLGNYSHWIYESNENKGYEVIVNDKTKKIIYKKNNLDAGGPFLIAVSPDSKYIVFDYGTRPGQRNFEVRNDSGKIIFKDSYLNKITWKNTGLEYGFPTSLPINLNDKTKICKEVGSAWEVELYSFDGRDKKKLDKQPTIECSN